MVVQACLYSKIFSSRNLRSICKRICNQQRPSLILPRQAKRLYLMRERQTADVGASAVYHVRGNQLPHQGKHWFPVLKGLISIILRCSREKSSAEATN